MIALYIVGSFFVYINVVYLSGILRWGSIQKWAQASSSEDQNIYTTAIFGPIFWPVWLGFSYIVFPIIGLIFTIMILPAQLINKLVNKQKIAKAKVHKQ